MTMYEFESCLRARLQWYNDAIALKTGERKWENGFNFPAGDVEVWRGAAMELKNTLDMVAKLQCKLGVTTPLGPIVAVPKEDTDYPGIQVYFGADEHGIMIATVEADTVSNIVQTVTYTSDNDEPKSVDEFCIRHTSNIWEHMDATEIDNPILIVDNAQKDEIPKMIVEFTRR